MLKTVCFIVGLFSAFFLFPVTAKSYYVVTCMDKVTPHTVIVDDVVVKTPVYVSRCI